MKKSIMLLLAGAVLFTGCGRDRTGTYKGTETIQINGGAAQSAALVITIEKDQDSTVSGKYEGAGGMGTFTGQLSDDGSSIINARASMPVQTGSSNGQAVLCGGDFGGTLKLTDNQISGSLSGGQQTQVPQNVNPSYYNNGTTNPNVTTNSSGYCSPGVRTVNASK